MDKIKINEYLQFFAKIVKQNDFINYNTKNDCKGIYHHLIRYGVSPDEKKLDVEVEGFFEHWQDYFRDKDNISVFVDPKWNYFCQFTNRGQHNLDYLKLFVPMKHDYLYKNAIILFDYLRQEKIAHVSKIGREIRFDNVVISLTNKRDLDKVINLIMNNPKLQKGLSEPNPFAFTNNNMAIVCDGGLSYNTIVSNYIGMYIQHKKVNNQLDNVNSDDFINYIKNYYKEVFYEGKNFDKSQEFFDINFNDLDNKEIIYLKHITELIIKSYQDNFTYDDLMTHFIKCSDYAYLKKEKQELKEVAIEKAIDDNALLREYFQVMGNKYNLDTAVKSFLLYIKTNDERSITRDNDLRSRIKNSRMNEKLNTYFKENKFSISDIRAYLIKRADEVKLSNIVSQQNQLLLNEYFAIMTNKYNLSVAVNNLHNYLIDGSADYITRSNNLRDCIYVSNLRDELNKYFSNCNYNADEIKNWLIKYYNNTIGNKDTFNSKTK